MLAKATKIKHLTQYSGDVWVYSLSKPLKLKKKAIKFVVGAVTKPAYGPADSIIWECDEDGIIVDNTPVVQSTLPIKEEFLKLKYEAN